MNQKAELLLSITKQITSKSVSLEQLVAISEILEDKSPKLKPFLKLKPKVEPKVEEPVVNYITFAKKYASDNNITYKEALIEIKKKSLYKSKTKTVKVKKVLKKDVGYKCDVCDYTSPNKSNFNRHMMKHNNREQLLIELMKARGLIRTHSVRAVKSKNEEVRKSSQIILDEAIKARDSALNQLKRLEKGPAPKDTQSNKVSMKKVAKKASLPESLINATKEAYKSENKSDLNLNKKTILSTKKTDDGFSVKVNFTVDDDEQIDKLIFEEDEGTGYSVNLIQRVDIKGKMTDIEYDRFFVYND